MTGAGGHPRLALLPAFAAQPVEQVQWKQSTARMRALLDEWKAHQRGKVRLDKDAESALWQRFSKARNGFDKARRSHFAHLEQSRGEAKGIKEDLVVEAERLSTSTDWNATAGAYKRLMDQWRRAGRAGRADDDRLWERFRSAQDTFFNAKDAEAAKEDEAHQGNLEVKEGLLAEAEALLPVKDLERTKAALRGIQERWEAAGKVPRADIDRMEKGMRRVEQTVREAEDKKWASSNPELSAHASSMVTQLESKVAELQADVEAAEAKGDTSRATKLREQLDVQQAWLDQAQRLLLDPGPDGLVAGRDRVDQAGPREIGRRQQVRAVAGDARGLVELATVVDHRGVALVGDRDLRLGGKHRGEHTRHDEAGQQHDGAACAPTELASGLGAAAGVACRGASGRGIGSDLGAAIRRTRWR